MQFSARTRIAKLIKKRTWRQYSDHVICLMPALSVLFFFIIEHSVLMVLVFYYKGMLKKVTIQRTQQLSAFSVLPKKNPVKCSACVVNRKIAIERGIAFSV